MNLEQVKASLMEYIKDPPGCGHGGLRSRPCEHLGALMQVAGDFKVDFAAEPWKTGLALMPRQKPWLPARKTRGVRR